MFPTVENMSSEGFKAKLFNTVCVMNTGRHFSTICMSNICHMYGMFTLRLKGVY